MGNCTQPLNSAPGQQSKQTKKTWAQTLDQVLNQIHNSDKQGSNLMSYEIWKHIFSKFKDFHFTKDEKLQFIQLLKKYFQVNNFQSQIEDEASFCGELGAKFHKLENTLYFKHKEALEYLKFVANKIYHQQKLSQLLFIQLKFDLSEQEVLEVAGKVRVFCSNDMSAFAFLSLYFQISIINKLKNQPLKKVQQIYQGLLKILQKKYPASILENQTLDIKKYFDKINSDHKIEELIFKENSQSHYDQLKGFVIMKAQSAKNDLHLFETLVKGVCYEKGYGFKSGVKIKNPDHSIAIFRTIEKLVQDKIENPGSTLEHAEDKDFSKHELNALIDEEKKLAHLKVEKIPNSQKSIKFQSKDLLRGKCTFSTIEDLVDTGNLLIAYIKSQGFEIIDLKDRLNKHTKDAVIIIKFPNSIAELQLVLQLDSVSNEFNHKLYQLTRSKLYSPITNLFVQNEKWGQQFFSQQFQLFEDLINSKTKIQANKDLAFYDFKKDLNEFRNNYLLPNQIICKKDQSFKLQDKKLVFAEIKHLIDLIKQKAKPKKQQDNRKQTIDYHEVKFFKENFDYKKAFEVLNKFDDKQLSKNRHLLRQKGQILKKQAKLDQSLECFLICQKIEANMPNKSEPQILDQAITFQNIGTVYYDQGNYQKALDNFEKSLAIKIKIQGNDSLDVAVSLTNIGLVYRSQGNYPKALQNYEKCLEIRTKLQGKDSINVSVTLENIGMAYFSQANYLKALENYQKCLEIRNKLKGKDSIDVAIIFNKIGNVYKNQGKHDKALQYFEKSLEIRIKVKGKESLDVAVAENSIGNVYHEQKNYQKALEHFERSLDLRIKVKGKDSIDVAVALNGIGNVYHEQGNFQKALENYKRCLEIRTKVKGEESIDVAAALESIGTVYNSQGDYQKALQHYERCMQINTKAKGKDCIDNAQTLYNISSTYKQMKKMEEAIESASESYRIRQQILGDNNPKTKSSLSRLQQLQNVQCTC